MTNDTKWEELRQAEEMAYFKADICLYSPESYILEEKKEICNEMMATSKATLDAMREDFQSYPPELRAKLLDMLCASGVETPNGGGMLRALSERALWHVRSEKARALSPRSHWPSSKAITTPNTPCTIVRRSIHCHSLLARNSLMTARLSFMGLRVVPHDRKPLFQAVSPLDELVVLLDLLREGVELDLHDGPALRVGEDHPNQRYDTGNARHDD